MKGRIRESDPALHLFSVILVRVISPRTWYLVAALLLIVACIHHPPAARTTRPPHPKRTPAVAMEGTTAEEGTTADEDEGTTDAMEGDETDGEPEPEATPAASDHPEAPTVLPGNIIFQTLREGAGRRPLSNEYVRVRYVGRLADGRVFDDSKDHGGELGIALNQVIRCWTTGVTHMNVGAKARLTCPPETAYGARGVPPSIPPNATLEFDIELIAIQPRR